MDMHSRVCDLLSEHSELIEALVASHTLKESSKEPAAEVDEKHPFANTPGSESCPSLDMGSLTAALLAAERHMVATGAKYSRWGKARDLVLVWRARRDQKESTEKVAAEDIDDDDMNTDMP